MKIKLTLLFLITLITCKKEKISYRKVDDLGICEELMNMAGNQIELLSNYKITRCYKRQSGPLYYNIWLDIPEDDHKECMISMAKLVGKVKINKTNGTHDCLAIAERHKSFLDDDL